MVTKNKVKKMKGGANYTDIKEKQKEFIRQLILDINENPDELNINQLNLEQLNDLIEVARLNIDEMNVIIALLGLNEDFRQAEKKKTKKRKKRKKTRKK